MAPFRPFPIKDRGYQSVYFFRDSRPSARRRMAYGDCPKLGWLKEFGEVQGHEQRLTGALDFGNQRR